jgi:hypothetical protein
MLKKQLSSNLLAEKIVITLILIITQPFWIGVNEYPAISILLILILIFCGYSLYTVYFVVSNLSYDDSHLYLKYRKQQNCIELKKIIQVKLTPYWGSWRSQWKVKYVQDNKEISVYFYLKYGFFSLNPFVKAIKNQNPSVDIQYITLDVDFD